MKYKIFIFLSLTLVIFNGCKKLIEIDAPKTSINAANIYEKDVTAASVLTGLYSKLSSLGIQYQALPGVCFFTGLSSDELALISGLGTQDMKAYSGNTLTGNMDFGDFWTSLYPDLYVINSAIEGVTNSSTLTPSVKQQLLGESKFLRAFYFFYLVNLYGDVPLVLSTDYKINSLMSRTPQGEVWGQIIKDLKESQMLLSSEYLSASLLTTTVERVRPTKAAATSLLARVYLYTKDWKNAEEQSTSVIKEVKYGLVDLDKVFLKNSKEAIWQLQPITKGNNSQEAIGFVLDVAQPPSDYNPVSLSRLLTDDFDLGDQRRVKWVNTLTFAGGTYNYAFKYKKVNFNGNVNFPVDEYSTIFRLAEQYLIRSEARIQQNNITGGIEDLNILRERATDKTAPSNLQLKTLDVTMSKQNALLAVEHERRIELFTEWGHRWLDLKRTGRVDAVMTIQTPKKLMGANWRSFQQWYPISLGELQNAPNVIQNQGY